METDTITPSVMRYSDQYPMSAPVMDMNYSTCIPSNGGTFTQNQEIRIPFIGDLSSLLKEGEGADDGAEAVQLASAPVENTAPLVVPNINPNLLAQASTGVQTLASGLTPTESALLSPEEQAIRLRSRGLA